jgi:hypothetical protein
VRILPRVVAAASVVLVLTSCARSIENLPGPSEVEVEAYRQQQLDQRWEYIDQTTDAERPVVDMVREVDNDDDWLPAMDECMTEQGFDWYYDGGSSVGVESDEYREAEIADYICLAKFPYTAQVLSTAQREYVYEYYVSWLTPCYSMHGYVVTNVPTKNEFMAQDVYAWHPANGLMINWATDKNGRITDPVLRQCGYYPKFMGIEF